MPALLSILTVLLIGGSPTPPAADSLFSVTRDRSIWSGGANSQALDLLLKKGEFIFLNDTVTGIPWMVTAGMVIDAPPGKVFSVIADFARYKEFMPQVEEARVHDAPDGFPEVSYTLAFRFAYIIPVSFSYTLKYMMRPPYRMDWVGVKDGKTSHYGFWELVPLEDGTKTAAFYSLYSTPQWSLFRKLVEKTPHLGVSTVLSTAHIVGEKIKARVEGDHRLMPEKSGPLTEREILGNRVDALASSGVFIFSEEPDDQGRKYVTGGTLIHATPEKIWDSILDFDDAPAIYPEVERTEIIGQDHGKETLVKFDLRMNYVLYSRSVQYTLKHVMENPRHLALSWVEGDAKGMDASWDLIPVNGGADTIALHRLYTDLKGSGLVARYILTRQPALEMAIQGSTVSVIVKGIKNWTEMTDAQRDAARKAKKKHKGGDNDRTSPFSGY